MRDAGCRVAKYFAVPRPRIPHPVSFSTHSVVIFRSSGFSLLDNAALAAVRKWQFLPAVHNGRTVAAWVEIPVRFTLR